MPNLKDLAYLYVDNFHILFFPPFYYKPSTETKHKQYNYRLLSMTNYNNFDCSNYCVFNNRTKRQGGFYEKVLYCFYFLLYNVFTFNFCSGRKTKHI